MNPLVHGKDLPIHLKGLCPEVSVWYFMHFCGLTNVLLVVFLSKLVFEFDAATPIIFVPNKLCFYYFQKHTHIYTHMYIYTHIHIYLSMA